MVRITSFRGKHFLSGFEVPTVCTAPRIFRLAELILKYCRQTILKGLPVLKIQQTREPSTQEPEQSWTECKRCMSDAQLSVWGRKVHAWRPAEWDVKLQPNWP